ncbi:hypothetical protein N0V87_007662 [Didymella glomerata]|uniref:N-acetyltransferase domain-containing protein n=1 Tax=Didymella glomerata TaxID=749621 RepID=A0A9W8WUG3_9PLEO|nr:hypothetical protein N0V87_007662 [Didymella glomerata]
MEPVLTTPRLKLTLITHAGRGSEELKWLHELRSDKQTTFWSIRPPSKTLKDTEKVIGAFLPSPAAPASSKTTTDPPPSALQPAKAYKIAYAVHETLPDNTPRFIGLITIISLPDYHLPLPPHLVIPKPQESTTLVTELAYSFLPSSWGRGYATESLSAVLNAVRSPTSSAFWAPWDKVWMRVIVNKRNPASMRVMRKLGGKGVVEKGLYEWKGEKIFVGGEWRTEDDLYIFGAWLRE